MITKTEAEALGEFSRMGFTLVHPDDHIVELHHESQMVARFIQTGATPDSLQNEAAVHLATKHGWDGCVWNRKKEGKLGTK